MRAAVVMGRPANVIAALALAGSPVVVVEPGDTLSGIADEHGTTWQALHAANPHLGDPDLIYPGDRVTINPGTSGAVSHRAAPHHGVWAALAECESGGDWSIDTGNGYYGGLQFSLASWRAVGGTGLPSDASPAEQVARAKRLLDLQGWGAWPACSAELGLRGP